MKFGIALFTDVIKKKGRDRRREAGEGWASVDGEPAKRINSVTELESNVKWLTNLSYVDFFANQLGKNPNLFYSAFMRTELKAIAEEIGAGVEQMSSDQSAQILSTVFARVAALATDRLGVNMNLSLPNVKLLHEFIAARTPSKNRIPDDVNLAMKHAYQPMTQCVTRYNREWKSATLRRPRYQHALEVLSTPVPSEHRWVYVDNARLPDGNNERIDWCLGNDLPVLANVAVKARRGDLAEVISYNSGASVERAWLSQPELLWISMFCDVDVIGAFVCEDGFEYQKELDKFPQLGDFSFCSYSLGLLVENLWVAMASPRTSVVNQKFYPPRAVWYRAIDRVEMFKAAAKLHRAGFQVAGYGVGSVWLNHPPGAARDLVDAAVECGLDVPMSKYFELRNETRLGKDE